MQAGTVAASPPGQPDAADDHGTRPIDLVHLARYTLGNRALEREILDLFVGQSRLTLAKLQAAVTEPQWREASHTLLGSARAVGAKRVAAAVAVAQKLPGGPANAQRAVLLVAIEAEIEAANCYIEDLFRED